MATALATSSGLALLRALGFGTALAHALVVLARPSSTGSTYPYLVIPLLACACTAPTRGESAEREGTFSKGESFASWEKVEICPLSEEGDTGVHPPADHQVPVHMVLPEEIGQTVSEIARFEVLSSDYHCPGQWDYFVDSFYVLPTDCTEPTHLRVGSQPAHLQPRPGSTVQIRLDQDTRRVQTDSGERMVPGTKAFIIQYRRSNAGELFEDEPPDDTDCLAKGGWTTLTPPGRPLRRYSDGTGETEQGVHFLGFKEVPEGLDWLEVRIDLSTGQVSGWTLARTRLERRVEIPPRHWTVDDLKVGPGNEPVEFRVLAFQARGFVGIYRLSPQHTWNPLSRVGPRHWIGGEHLEIPIEAEYIARP